MQILMRKVYILISGKKSPGGGAEIYRADLSRLRDGLATGGGYTKLCVNMRYDRCRLQPNSG